MFEDQDVADQCQFWLEGIFLVREFLNGYPSKDYAFLPIPQNNKCHILARQEL